MEMWEQLLINFLGAQQKTRSTVFERCSEIAFLNHDSILSLCLQLDTDNLLFNA